MTNTSRLDEIENRLRAGLLSGLAGDGVAYRAFLKELGFVAQSHNGTHSPKPQTDLRHGHRHRTPKSRETVEQSHADV